MTDSFSQRDLDRLEGVHPDLISRLGTIFDKMRANGYPMFVVQGLRTAREQADLYALGRTKPGHVVTMKDGYTHPSNHQAHKDGLGHAVDCAFAGNDPFANSHPWEAYGLLVEAQGLIWGGRWAHPHDSPHAELP